MEDYEGLINDYDLYGNNLVDQYDFNYDTPSETLADTVNSCIIPSIYQIVKTLYPLYLYCLCYQAIKSRAIFTIQRLNALNLIGSAIILVLHFTFSLALSLFAFAVVSYLVIQWLGRSKFKHSAGIALSVISLVYVLSCELLFIEPEKWYTIRGAQMILMMKIISYGFDFDSNRGMNCSLLHYLTYLLSVNTSIVGPWISYADFSRHLMKNDVAWFNFLRSIVYSLASLCFSNCLINVALYYVDSNSVVDAYTNAFSFRFSNYFILYCSQSLCLLTNIQHRDEKCKNLDENSALVHPTKAEFPRSLAEVVTNWNLPMHYWLKTYVFKQIKTYGSITALVSTYFVSSLLHGLNLKIAAVLFSLGVYTYVEHVFRKKLSRRLNACVGSRACAVDCKHAHKHFSLVVNLLFTLLNIYHLAYLGQMFDTTVDDTQNVNSLTYTLSKWSRLYYSSHLVVFLLFLISKFI